MRLISFKWPMLAFVIGLALIVAVPDSLEGPILLYLQEHAVGIVDVIGLALLFPALIQFHLRLMRIAKTVGSLEGESVGPTESKS